MVSNKPGINRSISWIASPDERKMLQLPKTLDTAVTFLKEEHATDDQSRIPAREWLADFISGLSSNSKVRELRLGDSITGQLPFYLASTNGDCARSLVKKMSTRQPAFTFPGLKSLTISCQDLGVPIGSQSTRAVWVRMADAAKGIESLRVELSRRYPLRWRRQGCDRRVSMVMTAKNGLC